MTDPWGADAAQQAPTQSPVASAVDVIGRRWDVPDCDDEPIFVLSSAWRSGSTLLQRLIVSSGRVFLWGEPHARADQVRRLADALSAFTRDWPRDTDMWTTTPTNEDLSRKWIANLSPSPVQLIDAHRAFVRTWLAPPAEFAGNVSWGFKEVRLSADHAVYLRLLFPRARFVFQVRNPYDQWRSYSAWRSWYDRWPVPVTTARQFGVMWRALTESFLERKADLNALMVRYEDLTTDPAELDALGRHLGIPLDPKALAERRGGTKPQAVRVRGDDLRELQQEVEPTASQMGYTAPSE